jgi:hypothetical protein
MNKYGAKQYICLCTLVQEILDPFCNTVTMAEQGLKKSAEPKKLSPLISSVFEKNWSNSVKTGQNSFDSKCEQ